VARQTSSRKIIFVSHQEQLSPKGAVRDAEFTCL
jgi:hypothetical protein